MMMFILPPDAMGAGGLGGMVGMVDKEHDHNKQPGEDCQDLEPQETLVGH
jgi:hypothetical protein